MTRKSLINFKRDEGVKEDFKTGKVTYKTKSGQKRKYVEISCREGHTVNVREDTLALRKVCCSCSKKYRKTPEYNCVDGMLQRCYNPNNERYENYGGRGVKVCDRWREWGYFGVKNFLEDMGKRPEGMTLDRIDVNGNYEPSNCRWANYSVQGYNQTTRKTNSSGRTGVSWDKSRGKWVARITKYGKDIPLGRFDGFEEAVLAREVAECKYFGEVKNV